ncbi:hypothetical protein ET495_01460 [Xylanimonas allomyrinae]|uniref:Cadherin domain-containing protein n=1 Tax=Xylanimonas allomyrinae TaxID=2509459 RepID=A0A4P6EI43_9MICO|nr:Ig-like domain-containing protein [Xylanimonas allomyrinae]QAY62162.1 hypothetical protein ET495_01460 [Xylanimonas allomyrinae]
MARWRRVVTACGALVGVAAIATGAVMWPGLDAQEPHASDPTVWVLNTGSGRYGRVNLDLDELETVRGIERPLAMAAQTSSTAVVFPEGGSKAAVVDEASPVDYTSAALADLPSMSAGADLVSAGGFIAYVTQDGGLFGGRIDDPAAAVRIDGRAPGDDDADPFVAVAAAVADDGVVTAYSSATRSVLQHDLRTGEDVQLAAVPRGPTGEGITVTALGERWAVLQGNTMWIAGADKPVVLDLDGKVVPQRAEPAGEQGSESFLVAAPTGLLEVSPAGAPSVVLPTQDRGIPAAPVRVDGVAYAAWLAQGQGVGTLWSSASGKTVPLDYAGAALEAEPTPRFVTTDGGIALNETTAGWVWRVPDGRLVPSSQHWEQVDVQQTSRDDAGEATQEAREPAPPVAVDDAFGVRSGEGVLTTLPVLLNDHDPNEDVLTIDPGSLTGLDPAFGSLSVTDDGQRLVFAAGPQARGQASFTYEVTDGTAVDGRRSVTPATVTLTVAEQDVEGAPRWCGDGIVAGCQMEWPSPQVAPGGTVEVPVLENWVDPDGDGTVLIGASVTRGDGRVAFEPEGTVVYQHENPAGADEEVTITVTVADTLGATATKDLTVTVAGDPVVEAESFATVAHAGETTSIDVTPHVSGTAGRMRLSQVQLMDQEAATATLAGSAGAFDFEAQTPGTYRLTYTVTDGASEAEATVRVTVVDPQDAALATAPVTVLVRPGEDVTADVLAAVHNPAGSVLMLTDVRPSAAPGGNLTVDAVASAYLRVAGTTRDAMPGRIGTVGYEVTDGTGQPGGAAHGEATVFLLPEPAGELPVAVDDVVTVRAGAQVDVPVTANDLTASGAPATLDPRTVRSSAASMLAFGSGSVLRILAPERSGDYRVDYGVFADGDPALADAAAVTVHVVGDDVANRKPRPAALSGRVLAGKTTRIPFDGLGVDPDGDPVRLAAIVTQPERGAAAVSADGRAIEYTSVAGDSGQRSFEYRLEDGRGGEASGTVRVGVLDETADPAPVTYTDYAQVQAGVTEPVHVDVLGNDLDPTGGVLHVTGVEPNVPVGTPEYHRLAGLVRNASAIAAGKADTVDIAAPGEPGRLSFRYQVTSESGNVGSGLIVLRAVRSAVPNFPVVADTVLTVETRDNLVDGVDVVDGKASWPGGDIGTMTLAVWEGDGGRLADGVTVSGTRLRGSVGGAGRLVPFSLTAPAPPDAPDAAPQTFGFLVVPAAADLTPARGGSAPPVTVDEDGTVRFDMADQVVVPAGRTLKVGGAVAASGARAKARCAATSGTQVEYRAGSGAPWADQCLVPVRFDGQSTDTMIPVPIQVVPRRPEPALTGAALTVSPTATVKYDLADMVSWPGDERGDVAPQVAVSGQATGVSIAQAGTTLTLVAGKDAVPGAVAVLQVTVTNYQGVAPAGLTVRIGPWPDGLPRGATVVTTCKQTDGSCQATVVGQTGEVDPRGSGLLLRTVDPHGTCRGLTFSRKDDKSVSIVPAADAPGGTCTTTFDVVTDGSDPVVGSGPNAGRLTVDFQGLPAAPVGVTQVGYAADSVTLAVTPGEAARAYPALDGFVVLRGGTEVGRCDVSGRCNPIQAPPGDKRRYEVAASNAIGRSRGTVTSADVWAYAPPGRPSRLEIDPVPNPDVGGKVRIVVTGVDVHTASVTVRTPTEQVKNVPVTDGRAEREVALANSGGTVTVVPESKYDVPPGTGPSGAVADASISATGNGVGAPSVPVVKVTDVTVTGDSASVAVEASAVSVDSGARALYGFAVGGQPCSPTAASASTTLKMAAGDAFDVVACAGAFVGDTLFGTSTSAPVHQWAVKVPDAPTDYKYDVNAVATIDNGGKSATWKLTDATASQPIGGTVPPRGFTLKSEHNDGFGTDFQYQVWFEHPPTGTVSDKAPVVWIDGGRKYPVRVAGVTVARCVAGDPLELEADAQGGTAKVELLAATAASAGTGGPPHQDFTGTVDVPAIAERVTGVKVRVSWPDSPGLAAATLTVPDADCEPADTDGDGLSDPDEARHHTSATNPDTDHDGVNDGDEVAAGSDPLTAPTPSPSPSPSPSPAPSASPSGARAPAVPGSPPHR